MAALLRAFADRTPQLLVLCDRSGHVQWRNVAARCIAAQPVLDADVLSGLGEQRFWSGWLDMVVGEGTHEEMFAMIVADDELALIAASPGRVEDIAARVEGPMADIDHALERGELHVVYQPQVSLVDGQVIGCEALVRWTHPVLGRVSPVEFIPVAERTGAIIGIDAWVLEQACHQVHKWGDRLDLHVNLSARGLVDPGLVSRVSDVLERTGLHPHQLCLEITETAVMDRVDEAVAVLESLRTGLGIKVGIDDFGIGHSSLRYLKMLPADVMKLDKAFIDNLSLDARDSAIVVAMVNLARSFGLLLVAEGVETDVQRRELRALGCTYAQGYLFSPPVPPEELELML